MKTQTFLTLLQAACVACVMLPAQASGQTDTLVLSGTFQMDLKYGFPGTDLEGVYARGSDHTWTLTLHDATYEYDYIFLGGDEAYDEQYITRVQATSFTLEFFGPDSATLNNVVSAQLTDFAIELTNGDYFDPTYEYSGPYTKFTLGLVPSDPSDGVQFAMSATNYPASFMPSHPTFGPQTIPSAYGSIFEFRSGGYGEIRSHNQAINIGSTVPPAVVRRVSILDGSAFEGDKGTSQLSLTLRMSSASTSPMSVKYRTIDGTATSRSTKNSPSDYQAATGTVTFQPGQTTQSIAITINGDRKREANETFTVQITESGSPVSLSEANAIATIRNDD